MIRLSDSITISGFGACMIGGFPDIAESFMKVACRLIEENLSRCANCSVLSLPGFPAARAKKHISRITHRAPNYVVFQFGSTDVSSQLMPSKKTPSKKTPKHGAPSKHFVAPTPLTLVRWHASSLAGCFLKPAPASDLSSYLSAHEDMISECQAVGATPVVLSPFVFGTRHSMNSAIKYSQALGGLCRTMDAVIFIDCVELLSHVPRSRILLCDAMHLSELGHQLVGRAVGEAVVADFVAKSRLASGAKHNVPLSLGSPLRSSDEIATQSVA